jgi:hypothetical protein
MYTFHATEISDKARICEDMKLQRSSFTTKQARHYHPGEFEAYLVIRQVYCLWDGIGMFRWPILQARGWQETPPIVTLRK